MRERYGGRGSDREHDRKPYERNHTRRDSRERRSYDSRDNRDRRYDDRGGDRDHHERRNYYRQGRERSSERRTLDDRRAHPKQNYRPVHEDDAIGSQKHKPSSPARKSQTSLASDSVQDSRSRRAPSAAAESDGEQQEAAENEDDAEAQMAAMMGFGGFGTTKGAKVQGNVAGGIARPAKKIEYRQYMNRIGGFNRPISPS